MAGIIKEKGQKPIIINGVSDHVHVFVGLKPSMRISDLIRDIKNNSSNFINEKGFLKNHFSWQEGYGAFSYSHYELDKMYHYIANQEEHHRKTTFRDEYIKFLKEFDIEFKDQYLFDFYN
jgi:REP element-mobilizing transposase RayT